MDASTECSSRRSPELVGVFAVVQSLMLRFPLPSLSNEDLPWTCRGNLHTTPGRLGNTRSSPRHRMERSRRGALGMFTCVSQSGVLCPPSGAA